MQDQKKTIIPKAAGLTDDERERYRGHLALPCVNETGQLAIKAASMAIIGLGGLGSPVALYLAAAGVGKLRLIDDDIVSTSNLQRQIIHFGNDVGKAKIESAAEKIKAINPRAEVECVNRRFSPSVAATLLSGIDVVADCTDNFQSRVDISDACHSLGIPCVTATVTATTGQMTTFVPGHARFSDIFGREAADSSQTAGAGTRIGILGPAVGVMGALQATEVIKIVTAAGRPIVDSILLYDALDSTFRRLPVAPLSDAGL